MMLVVKEGQILSNDSHKNSRVGLLLNFSQSFYRKSWRIYLSTSKKKIQLHKAKFSYP